MNQQFAFNLDPCASHDNAKCARYFTRAEDGLAQDWGAATVFMNPPYGREIRHWMRKAFESARAGATVVCLVPARTDTDWWHRYAIRGEIRFLKGRLKFGNAPHAAPFPSAVVVFRPEALRHGPAPACGAALYGDPAPLPAAVPKTPPTAPAGWAGALVRPGASGRRAFDLLAYKHAVPMSGPDHAVEARPRAAG